MLSDISQVVRDRYHMISQTSKQNITRDIEIKNTLTVTRGDRGEDNGGKGGELSRNMYKGPMDKVKGGMLEGRRRGRGVWWSENGDNCT